MDSVRKWNGLRPRDFLPVDQNTRNKSIINKRQTVLETSSLLEHTGQEDKKGFKTLSRVMSLCELFIQRIYIYLRVTYNPIAPEGPPSPSRFRRLLSA